VGHRPDRRWKVPEQYQDALNGLHFDYGVPAEQIKITATLHGPANILNYDDYVWSKYQIGEWLKAIDPATKKPAVRNISTTARTAFRRSRLLNPDDHDTLFQDTSQWIVLR
jgi:hypothetical protein